MTTGNNIETEYLELSSKNGWPLLYQQIRTESAKFGNSFSEAIKPQNKVLNRYRDVSPFDHTRIVLQKGSSDYINANLVKVEKANRQYILTQGPLPHTISHFWLMVWEQNTKAVLMLNKLVEKKQEKCSQYWPKKVGPEYKMIFDDVGLSLEYLEHQDHSYYMKRVLKLVDVESGNSKEVLQFHYTTWPDFGVPNSPVAFLEFLYKVRAEGALQPDVGPAVVHCSAGIGRSGTFCLVDSCLVLIEKYGLNSVDVKEVLLEMRRYRMGLIQTPEQLKFSYQAIIEGIKHLSQPNTSDKENSNSDVVVVNDNDLYESSSEEDEPPPLPPPRLDSLNRVYDDFPVDRPLPTIPNSTSLTDFAYEENDKVNNQSPPLRPLPTVTPGDEGESSEADEVEEEEEDEDEEETNSLTEEKTENNCVTGNISPEAELRHRQRAERKETLAAKVREMKRRQQANEQWTRLKRPKTQLGD
ncbi:tyrosine-protein phosphatase non-receptor type 2 isoform X2 [Agrilus planipennis]|uniref:protein-tyrosine-phosphatase n=1 Tax=Agrilus planipennis TaxID=224129 RepID=A0A7F5RJ63_AGRPL|nr:tyrosine-protein phosphatase non-receptor type 2 isoform X2 [Agrilus planipennis]